MAQDVASYSRRGKPTHIEILAVFGNTEDEIRDKPVWIKTLFPRPLHGGYGIKSKMFVYLLSSIKNICRMSLKCTTCLPYSAEKQATACL